MEDVFRVVVLVGGLLAAPVGVYFAVRFGNLKLRRLERGAIDDETTRRVAELEHQVLELHERLDFTERLLAAQREDGRLPR